MNTHKLLLFILLMLLAFVANAQLNNCNPDPNGESWWGCNMRITPEVVAELQAIPIMTPYSPAIDKTLPFKN